MCALVRERRGERFDVPERGRAKMDFAAAQFRGRYRKSTLRVQVSRIFGLVDDPNGHPL
jgi:hypothetical protein